MNRAILPLAGLTAVAHAQSALLPLPDAPLVVLAATELIESASPIMHGTVGSDFTSAYFFRGIQQENQGAIAEPYLQLRMSLFEGCGEFRSIDLKLGQWNSLHDGPTGTAGPQSLWYEHDLYVGIDIKGDRRWTLGSAYTVYYSPNGRFDTVQEISASLSYDDAGLAGASFGGLQPSFLVAFETQGRADGTGESGTYGEIGISPSFTLGDFGGLDVTLALPVKVGMSLGHYYERATGADSKLGYVDVGAVLRAPLSFLPRRAGPWEGTFGVHALFLGDSNQALNQNDEFELLVTCGFSTTF